MSASTLRTLIAGPALAVCLAGPVGTDALAQDGVHGKLGTAGVKVSRQAAGGGTLIIIVNQGREFAKYSAPQSTQAVLLCCTFGKCSPITPNTALFCDIVINCPGEACYPQ
jgi:hypothetical protein